MTTDMQTLVERCDGIFQGCGAAIEWVKSVRSHSHRLNREAGALIGRLRRLRNLSGRLGRAAERPVSVGFFGLSQGGKSYLISALAAGDNGELETLLDGERLNFISHVNPPGGGKEATGLVTRFTRQAGQAPAGFPIQLTLLSEVDLVKVLGNAFFNDFDREKVTLQTEPVYIRQLLSALEKKRQTSAVGGVSEDDIVDLLDYFDQRYKKSMEPLAADYWPTAVELAPYLTPNDRVTLFSVLWGEIEDLSQTYLMLRNSLGELGHPTTVYAPIEALVTRAESGEWSQTDSIMNVDILERLGRDLDDRIAIRSSAGSEQPSASMDIPRSILAALTTEIKFILAEQPVSTMLEEVDLLDFPGYRGRLSIGDLSDVKTQLKDERVNPVAQLVLRGKVAYLFERYTEDQEMNVLVLCTPSHKQMDISSLGPVLENWIHSTQGDCAEIRSGHGPGLVWAISMFDFRLAPAPGQTTDMMRIGWEGMMKMALLERFGQYEWLQNWRPGQAFDNLFLVRKPRMASDVIETRDGQEYAVIADQRARLDQLKATFLETPLVQKHVRAPEAAWDAMIALNDGGITRLSDYLQRAARATLKLERIREQTDAVIEELVEHRLGLYHQKEGAAEVDQKEKLAATIIDALKKRGDRFGELLAALQPSPEHLRSLYLRADGAASEDGSGKTPEAESQEPENAGLINLDVLPHINVEAGTSEAKPVALNGAGSRFIQAAMDDWIRQLRELPERADQVRFLGVSKNVLERLGNELITAAERLALEQRLMELVEEAELRTAASRARLAERQVLAVRTCINEFVDFLGNSAEPVAQRPTSQAFAGRHVFQPPARIAKGALPELADRPINFSALYILDWLQSFSLLAKGNAGHSPEREISTEHNERLGKILASISGGSGALP